MLQRSPRGGRMPVAGEEAPGRRRQGGGAREEGGRGGRCGREDLNLHPRRDQDLNLARLPNFATPACCVLFSLSGRHVRTRSRSGISCSYERCSAHTWTCEKRRSGGRIDGTRRLSAIAERTDCLSWDPGGPEL